MYAEMNPAKEVGGDLYSYVMQGNMLYFCVGDVSGKGVPASLFMAQSARLFRTLAAEGMMPADIAVRMNNELTENQQKQLLGNKRLQELMADTQDLDSHQMIDMLKSAVEAHRNGAEPNDDLTLLAIHYAI